MVKHLTLFVAFLLVTLTSLSQAQSPEKQDTVPICLSAKITGGTPIESVRYLPNNLNPEGGSFLVSDSYPDIHLGAVAFVSLRVSSPGSLFLSYDNGNSFYLSSEGTIGTGLIIDSLTASNDSILLKARRPSGLTNLYSISSLNPSYRLTYLLGLDSAIFSRSSDTGRTWMQLPYSVPANPFNAPVTMQTDPTGQRVSVMVQPFSSRTFTRIVSSGDAGTTWRQVWPDSNLPQKTYPSDCEWWDAKRGIIVATQSSGGGYIAVTEDGGQNWRTVVSDTNQNYGSIFGNLAWNEYYTIVLQRPSTVILVGPYHAVISTDLGRTWTTRDSFPSILCQTVTGRLIAVSRIPSTSDLADFGYAHYSNLMYSDDLGANWHSATWNCHSLHLTAAAFKDAENGVLFSVSGLVGKTSDGGATWECTDSTVVYTTTAIARVLSDRGGEGGYYGFIPINYTIPGVFPGDTSSQLFRSTDRGATWKPLLSEHAPYTNVCAVSDGVVWLGGTGFVVYSRDNVFFGNRINFKTLAENTFIQPIRGGSCWVGNPKELYRTTNGGRVWSSNVAENIPGYSLDSSYQFMAANVNVVLAENSRTGRTYSTNDGGQSWHLGTGRIPTAIIDSTHWLYKAQVFNTEYETSSDGGVTFDSVTSLAGQGPFYFVDSLRWMSQQGIYTSDGGKHWKPIPGWQLANEVGKFTIVDSGTALGSRDNWGVWRLDMPWFKAAPSAVAEQATFGASIFSFVTLNPQPARVTSTVHFTLSKSAAVSLTILDIDGREVRRSGQREFESGQHQITFNVASLAIGSYTLRLQSGSDRHLERFIVLR